MKLDLNDLKLPKLRVVAPTAKDAVPRHGAAYEPDKLAEEQPRPRGNKAPKPPEKKEGEAGFALLDFIAVIAITALIALVIFIFSQTAKGQYNANSVAIRNSLVYSNSFQGFIVTGAGTSSANEYFTTNAALGYFTNAANSDILDIEVFDNVSNAWVIFNNGHTLYQNTNYIAANLFGLYSAAGQWTINDSPYGNAPAPFVTISNITTIIGTNGWGNLYTGPAPAINTNQNYTQ